MHYLTTLAVLSVVGLSSAWYKNKPSNNEYGWLPNRRSLHCVSTGGQCVNSYQCCNPGEQCLVSEKLNTGSQFRSRFGQCLNLETFMKAYEAYEKEKTFGFKKSGDACDDSTECADQCCREVKKGRFGSVTRACGKPGEYTCIWRKFSSPNDIYGY